MKILVLGADGKLGKFVINDLINKHNTEVYTLTRKPFDVEGTTNFVGSPMNITDLEKAAKGMNIILSTLGAATVEDFKILAENVIKVAKQNNALIIWSGGAGSLIDKDGKRLVDNPPTDPMFKAAVLGQSAAFEKLKSANGINFIYLSPAITMDYIRDEKQFSIQVTDNALYNNDGESIIGYKTQAQALCSLVDNNSNYLNKRLTIVER